MDGEGGEGEREGEVGGGGEVLLVQVHLFWGRWEDDLTRAVVLLHYLQSNE